MKKIKEIQKENEKRKAVFRTQVENQTAKGQY
jgi:hypothetical protein